jgi:diguanylate cyclase (GGDEF)-like protein
MKIPESNLPDRQTRILITLFGLFLVVAIGILRYATGSEYAFSLLYLAPIIMVGWYVGFWPGIVVAITGASTWLAADLMMVGSFSSPAVPFINETLRLTVFLIMVYAVTSLRQKLWISRSDYLTGLANVRHFLELADIELRRARRYSRPLTGIFIDLDDFKEINDEFGHETGDKALRLAARCFADGVREIDIVARFGGDEFLILMPETATEDARVVLDRLQVELPETMNAKGWRTTFSAGVATFASPPADATEILRKTDELMYMAKAAGKNTVKYEVIAG